MAAVLSAFLRQAAREPFQFGEWDCALTIANWVKAATGRDPAAELRGRYRTDRGWRRIVEKSGGLRAIFTRLARKAGLRKVEGPVQPGDIALVSIRNLGCFGAIRGDGHWVVKLDSGLMAGPARVIAAWRLPEVV